MALPISALLIGWAYSYAATHTGGQTQFTIFWVGVAVFVLPATARLLTVRTLRESRLLVIAFALLFSVPKFLRNPDLPLFHDEFAHWRQVEEILRTHHLFNTNFTIYVIGEFPGLHALTAGLSLITGMSAWRAGQVVLLACHITILLGVFEIARRILGNSPRAAGIAALIYATNPSYMFFDAQFAYESLGIVLFVWLVVVVTRLSVSDEPAARSCMAFAVLLAGATVMTHHLSALAEIGVLSGATTLGVWRTLRLGTQKWVAVRLAGLLLVTVAFAVAWVAFVAPNVVGYLAPHITQGFTQLPAIIEHTQSSRGVFKESPLPSYEQFCGLAAVAVVALLVAYGAWTLRGSTAIRRPGLLPVMLALAVVYFVSLPLIFTSSGTEGAHRSWGFSFVGVAIIGAFAVEHMFGAGGGRRARRLLLSGAVLVALMVVLIGNVASSVNESYRFPGPFIWGSGTRSTDAELVGLARAFRRRYGVNRKVVADAYSSLAFAAYGDAQTAQSSGGFPIWELYFKTITPAALLRELSGSKWQFVVVDRRMPYVHPLLGVYVSPGEHPPNATARPPSTAAFSKFGRVPWLRRVMQSNHFDVYEFDYERLGAALQ